jgi:hypothetical protein
MPVTEKPLSKAIDIAVASKSLLLHVDGIHPLGATAAQDEFCGLSLSKAQMGTSPMLLALSMSWL